MGRFDMRFIWEISLHTLSKPNRVYKEWIGKSFSLRVPNEGDKAKIYQFLCF